MSQSFIAGKVLSDNKNSEIWGSQLESPGEGVENE
jgi:hypothetical protein